ncbi:hypothetical protein HanXRQr2_Chr13g0606691 [Helianthus annuus]|uniref:Uncharacterized protein n=1 Tax=Helianthus annuus TaxID=4232 RepID=A0A9K3EJN6_HELAN|nr:hypothetical protein HanXRQr2_Chr13g0606691 [Helianthus annuus]KAJ0850790.1 hypothetical protein HanPSC8_Chr13g0584921 [Helianthus annuus]
MNNQLVIRLIGYHQQPSNDGSLVSSFHVDKILSLFEIFAALSYVCFPQIYKQILGHNM